MNRSDQRKITKNLIALRKIVHKDFDTILDRLVEANVFTKDVSNEIKTVHQNMPQLRCGMLINKLLRSGKDSYKRFREVLESLDYHDLVETMEKSIPTSPEDANKMDDREREKTFIIPSPRIPDTISTPEKAMPGDNTIDEVRQLERMMTFVMSHCEDRDNNNNKTESKRELRQKLAEESKGNGELLGFFKSFRYGSFSLTSQSLVH